LLSFEFGSLLFLLFHFCFPIPMTNH
jgi:hypothetical protein